MNVALAVPCCGESKSFECRSCRLVSADLLGSTREVPRLNTGSGGPTVADRIAQTVVASRLEAVAEPEFHPDSFGYRPGRSALDAVARCLERCWGNDWVIDLDIQKFFDSVPWHLIVKAVEANTDQPWVVLYVKRWLAAPLHARRSCSGAPSLPPAPDCHAGICGSPEVRVHHQMWPQTQGRPASRRRPSRVRLRRLLRVPIPAPAPRRRDAGREAGREARCGVRGR
ncbi:reverse transcriptase domain-containing protein [Streptomyces sp. CoT10]|uniref:reverse transcriptase domain-containing protein n=1 Tax=Streptomyces sp. CoT10 TaxID=2875762 RepID=UPI0027E11336|nr:reverse transcriptase domain-containing protein [Streptomyces sp. CoT10]